MYDGLGLQGLVPTQRQKLRVGQRLGKYRLLKRLGEGGSCEVWQARDSVESIVVALKIPHLGVDGQLRDQQLSREIRLLSSLRHPNIMPVKNADVIDGRVVLATELSVGTLADRSKPMAPRRVIMIMGQVLEGLAYAHGHRVVHCDVSPMNIFLFPDGRAALGDFGISLRIHGRMETIDDFGTPGYVAPEQAYGRPVYSSDCFAVSLVLYEYLTGVLPRWPFKWPLRGLGRLRDKTNTDFVAFMRKGLCINPAQRFAQADQMLTALHEAIPRRLRGTLAPQLIHKRQDWLGARRQAFQQRYGKVLGPLQRCCECKELITEAMLACPWCGSTANRFDATSAFSHICRRCHRGMLPEWRYCPWCYGVGYEPTRHTRTPGFRYPGHCAACQGPMLRFMRYCPWCRAKVRIAWAVRPFPEVCGKCDWSVDSSHWRFCPWCCDRLY
jgi:serine/threonine protein kinase